MNYSTYLIESLQDYKKSQVLEAVGVDMVCNAIRAAHKYVIPPPRSLKTRVDTNSVPFIRMPFPEVVFEYEVPDSVNEGAFANLTTTTAPKRVALLIDLKASQTVLAFTARSLLANIGEVADIAVVSGFYMDQEDRWSISFGFGYWKADTTEFFVDGNTNKVAYGVLPLFPSICAMIGEQLGEDAIPQNIRNDVHEEVAIGLRALALINARNVNVVQIVEAPYKLNAKRMKNKKAPFFSYHTLSVFLDPSRSHRKLQLQDAQRISSMWASSRLHQVAGHFKIRRTGMFWWNPHFRGAAENGVITSEHVVK